MSEPFVHLTTAYNFGSLPSQYLSRLPCGNAATINALGAVVANPFRPAAGHKPERFDDLGFQPVAAVP
jgi:hypothetical protein